MLETLLSGLEEIFESPATTAVATTLALAALTPPPLPMFPPMGLPQPTSFSQPGGIQAPGGAGGAGGALPATALTVRELQVKFYFCDNLLLV